MFLFCTSSQTCSKGRTAAELISRPPNTLGRNAPAQETTRAEMLVEQTGRRFAWDNTEQRVFGSERRSGMEALPTDWLAEDLAVAGSLNIRG